MTAAQEMPVRVRFAPSPTGFLHIGSVRTALFNWIFARQNGGVFVLRIEDTDTERSKPEYEKDIIENFRWLGLDWDEGPDKGGPFAPYRQSERTDSYRKNIEKLLAEGKAYYCFCSKEQLEIDRQTMLSEGLPPRYNGRCRSLKKEEVVKKTKAGEPSVIRFLTPETEVEFTDIVRGKVKFDASLTGDMIIAKSPSEPLYNFASVVDDEAMRISHIIRAEEHLSNTPKQILIQNALGFRQPRYAHIPLILNPDKSKMSKRYLESSVKDYREQGYLPEAIVNFLALLGWHPQDDREIMELEEIVKEFDLKRVQKAGAVFNTEKLGWINSQKIKKMPVAELAEAVKPFLSAISPAVSDAFASKVADAERERAKTLKELAELSGFFFELPEYDAKILTWKKDTAEGARNALTESAKTISSVPDKDFTKEKVSGAISVLTDKLGRGQVLWPLRVALSGKEASPDPLVIMDVLGKEESLARIDKAIEKLK